MISEELTSEFTTTALTDTVSVPIEDNTYTLNKQVCVLEAKLPLKGINSILTRVFCEARCSSQALVPSFSAIWLLLAVVPWVTSVGGASDMSRWLPCLEWLSI